MKYAMLRQQPLLKVQVASSKNFFKERNTKHLLSGGKKKTSEGIEGAKNGISKVKGKYAKKQTER